MMCHFYVAAHFMNGQSCYERDLGTPVKYLVWQTMTSPTFQGQKSEELHEREPGRKEAKKKRERNGWMEVVWSFWNSFFPCLLTPNFF